jgi:hypothetical protein
VEYAEAFLKDQISAPLRSLIPSTLKTCYEAAAILIGNEIILNVTSAQDIVVGSFNGRSIKVLSASVKAASGRLISAGAFLNDPPDATLKSFLHIPS